MALLIHDGWKNRKQTRYRTKVRKKGYSNKVNVGVYRLRQKEGNEFSKNLSAKDRLQNINLDQIELKKTNFLER